MIDTGASESAVGSASLQKLLHYGQFAYSVHVDDRPIFRFGNGLKMQAMSRVDIEGTAIGQVSFTFWWNSSGYTTSARIQGAFHQRAHISYANSTLIFEAGPWDGTENSIFCSSHRDPSNMAHDTGPAGECTHDGNDNFMIQSLPTFSSSTASTCENVSEVSCGEVFLPLYVMSTSCKSTSSLPDRLQLLAQRLHQLRGHQPS